MYFDFETVLWLAIFSLEGAIIIFCNILGFIIFTRKARRFRPCLLLANQCLADCLLGFEIGLLTFIYYLEHKGVSTYEHATSLIRGSQQCANIILITNSALWNLAFGQSVLSLAFIALERAHAVFKPFEHHILRKKTYFLVIIGTWIFNTLFSLTYVFLNCYQVSRLLSDLVYGITFVISSFVFSALVFSYLAIYIKLRFFPTFQASAHARKESRFCRVLFYASVASLVLFCPTVLIQIYLRLNCFENSLCLSEHIENLAKVFLFSNSFVNFFIYAWKFPGFVESFKRLICCRIEATD